MEKCHGKRKTRSLLRNSKGQFAIEAVLLMTVLLGGFFTVTKIIRDKQMIGKLFGTGITSIRNMTGYGTFKESCQGLGSSKSKQTLSHCHPNSISRALSSDPNN